jgi:hypothetical protein
MLTEYIITKASRQVFELILSRVLFCDFMLRTGKFLRPGSFYGLKSIRSMKSINNPVFSA